MEKVILVIVVVLFFLSCNTRTGADEKTSSIFQPNIVKSNIEDYDKETKTIHILVALCDNKNQGIVPVPEKIGNGQDPKHNLYWGTAYGIKTYFKRSDEWDFVKTESIDAEILERAVFKHKTSEYYIVADAYNGKFIKKTTEKFLRSSCGKEKDILKINDKVIGIEGNAKLLAYIGHDGLMDFQIREKFKNLDNKIRDVIILACYSKDYFEPHLEKSNVNSLVWTTGLMAPEAYTIHDAITGYINNETNEAIRLRAAKAYSKYQKCSLKAAKRLLVSN